METAAGQVFLAPTYEGRLQIVGLDIQLSAPVIALGDEFILGRAIIDRFRVTFDHGQTLRLEA